MKPYEILKDKLAWFGGYKWLPYIDAVKLVEEKQKLQTENDELKKSFKLRGKKIIKLQNELIEQSKFYEDLLQKWDEEKENLEKGV